MMSTSRRNLTFPGAALKLAEPKLFAGWQRLVRCTLNRLFRLFALLALVAMPVPAMAADIALSLPLGGTASVLAKQFETGARLALETIDETKRPELLIVDDGCDDEIGGLAADDVANSGARLAMGYFCNAPARLAAIRLKEENVPVLVNGARSIQLIKDAEKEEWDMFKASPDDDDVAQRAFEVFSKRWLGIPYAIVDDGTIYGRTLADQFRSLMEEAGLAPQFVDNFRPAQSTQAGLIRRLQRSDVQAAFIATAADDFATIAQNQRDFGGNFELAGPDTLRILPFLESAGNLPDGILAIMRPLPETLDGTQSLTKILEQLEIEAEPAVYEGYAAMQIALQALGDTPQETIENLADGQFQTVLGPVSFGPNGNIEQNPFSLFVFRDGAFVSASGS